MIQLGIFARTWDSANVQTLFKMIKEHGLEHVHFNMSCCGLASQPLEIPIEITTQVKTAANENSISIIGLSSTFNMIHPDSKVRDEGIKSLEVLASCCSSLGTRFISLCSGTRDPINKWKWHPENASAASWKQLLQILEKAVTIAEKYQVYLGIEPEEGNVICNARKARKLLNEVRSDRIKTILDPANFFETTEHSSQINELIEEAVDLLHNDIWMAHAKDRDLMGNIRAPGKGDIDFKFYVSKLKEIDFNGYLVMHGLEEQHVAGAYGYLNAIVNA